MPDPIVIVYAGMLVAGLSSYLALDRAGLRPWQSLLGGVSGSLLTGGILAEWLVWDFGAWWADRPMATGTVTAVISLALTALAVEARESRSDAVRRRPAEARMVRALL